MMIRLVIMFLALLMVSCDPAPLDDEGLMVREVSIDVDSEESIIFISWQPPTDGEPVGYAVYIDNSSAPILETGDGDLKAETNISNLRSGVHFAIVEAIFEEGSRTQGTPTRFYYNASNEMVRNLNAKTDTEIEGNVLLSWELPELADEVLSFEIRLDGKGPISVLPDKTEFSFSMLNVEGGELFFSVTAVYGGAVRSISEVLYRT